jgi:hypothetical protein
MYPPNPWTYPNDRYHYGWWDAPITIEPTDGEIKSRVVHLLRETRTPRTASGRWTSNSAS